MYAYVRNQVIPLSEAFLHVSDLAIQRGYGVFDFFKISGRHAFFLDAYFDRFYHSAQQMRLAVPLERAKLVDVIHELMEKNAMESSGMKMILTGGYSADGYHPAEPNLVISQHALTLPTSEQVKDGVAIITHDYVREFPQAKTIQYAMGILLIDRLKTEKAADVLYHRSGFVSEFPRSNFFIVDHHDTVITADENVLEGITRGNVLRLAEQYYRAEVRPLRLEEVFRAKEAFLTSTTKRVLPVVRIDGRPIGSGVPGRVTTLLLHKLVELEEFDRGGGR